ncbi:MAG: TrkA family potassium uptake protein [Kiritimatiellia bacterium]
MQRVGIIGGGRFGSALASCLVQRGVEVVLLDRDRGIVQRMMSVVSRAVEGDATEMQTLIEAGFERCDTAVVAIGTDLEGSILATMNLKELKIRQVVSKAATELHGSVLQRLGADRVIYPDRDMAIRLARSIAAPSILDYIELSGGASIVEMKTPAELVGKTLGEAKIRNIYGVHVLALRHKGVDRAEETTIAPSGSDTINDGDTLVLFGPDERIRNMSQNFA